MPTLWERIKGWKEKEGKRLVAERIPRERVDLAYDDTPLVADGGYLRVWLAEMYLGKERSWFKDWHPAVHSLVRLRFADQTIELARVAAASQERFQRGEGAIADIPLLDLAPFPGGVVTIEAALIGLAGDDLAAGAIAVLADFGSLVSAPLSTAIDIAAKVKSGADRLLAKDGELRVCFQESYTTGSGTNELRPGYVAVVRAEVGKDLDPTQLRVRQGKLMLADEPLRGFDYMLLRIEGRKERDDWRHFKELAALRARVVEATLQGSPDADSLLRGLVAHVLSHPDLALFDRKRIALALRQEIKDLAQQARGAAEHERTFEAFMAALPPPRVADRSPMSIAEVMED